MLGDHRRHRYLVEDAEIAAVVALARDNRQAAAMLADNIATRMLVEGKKDIAKHYKEVGERLRQGAGDLNLEGWDGGICGHVDGHDPVFEAGQDRIPEESLTGTTSDDY